MSSWGRGSETGDIIDFTPLPIDHIMARRTYRRKKNYKLVNTWTKSFGSAGDQILLGNVSKLDAQGISAWLNNVVVTAQLNEGDGDAGGMTFYLTTDNTWNDDYIITGRAMPGYGGTVSLTAKRPIRGDVDEPKRNDGIVYVWGEITDLSYISNADVRVIIETWGRSTNL